jgi:hypothetical protein
MSLLVNDELKPFLQREDIRECLSKHELDVIYDECDYGKPHDPNYLRPRLTFFFIVGLHLNPLQYMSVIPNNFISSDGSLYEELMSQFVKKIIIPKNINTIEEFAIPKTFRYPIQYLGTVQEFTEKVKGADTLLNYHQVICEDGIAEDINPISW